MSDKMADTGPWTATNGDIVSNTGRVILWAYATAKCGMDGDDFYSCRPPSAEATVRWKSPADLTLVLAAPDLLAALKGVLRVADRETAEFDAARAAISKAEGAGSHD